MFGFSMEEENGEEQKMIKIGIVGGASSWHARSFSEMFNGYDMELAKKHNFPIYEARIEGAIVTHLWDENLEQARLLSKVCGIGEVMTNMEDMIGKVDGVIIADDETMKHQRRAIPFLKSGMPTMIDKPLSPNIDEAVKLVELAKANHAPMMSCSALRYAKEVAEVLSKREELGDIMTGNTICSGDLIYYGVHALEQLYVVVGQGIRCVQNLGERDKDIVVITLKDGRKFVLTAYKNLFYLFQMNLYGTKGWREVRVEDSNFFYSKMLEAYVRMVKTREMPFQPDETLEIIKALVLARESANEGAKVFYL